MNPTDFQAAVERHKADMLRMAAQSGQPENAVGTPITLPEDEDAIVFPPENGAGRGPLQTISPEQDTYEAFRAQNQETGFLRIQAFAGRQVAPVPNATVLVTHTFTDRKSVV